MSAMHKVTSCTISLLLACSLAFPCRSFDAAIAQTLLGGEVIVLDSAGYGPAVISQSVSIIAPPGVYGGVTVFSGTGLVVSPAASQPSSTATPGSERTRRRTWPSMNGRPARMDR